MINALLNLAALATIFLLLGARFLYQNVLAVVVAAGVVYLAVLRSLLTGSEPPPPVTPTPTAIVTATVAPTATATAVVTSTPAPPATASPVPSATPFPPGSAAVVVDFERHDTRGVIGELHDVGIALKHGPMVINGMPADRWACLPGPHDPKFRDCWIPGNGGAPSSNTLLALAPETDDYMFAQFMPEGSYFRWNTVEFDIERTDATVTVTVFGRDPTRTVQYVVQPWDHSNGLDWGGWQHVVIRLVNPNGDDAIDYVELRQSPGAMYVSPFDNLGFSYVKLP